jgi:Papain fold toxin 1, glutamine deamidase
MHPARRRLIFLSAAIAAIAAVLALALPAGPASAAAVSATGTRVGASHPVMILPAEVSHPVSAGERRCAEPSQPGIAAGACVAAEETAGGTAVANPLGGTMNCVACAIAGDARLSGSAASALDVGPQPISKLEDMYGGSFQSVSGRSETDSILGKQGPRSRGIVFGSRGTGAVGHIWNAVNQGGVIRYPDFQSGMGASFEGYKSLWFLLTAGGG